MYKQFLEYKDELNKMGISALAAYKAEDDKDIFKYAKPDAYFGDYDDNTWNNTPLGWNMAPEF